MGKEPLSLNLTLEHDPSSWMAPPFIVVDGSAVQRLDSFELATATNNLNRWSWIAERSTTIASRFNKSFDLLSRMEKFFEHEPNPRLRLSPRLKFKNRYL